MKAKRLILITISSILLCSCNNKNINDDIYNNVTNSVTLPINLSYNFEKDHMEWIGGFSDLPSDYKKRNYNIKYDYGKIELSNDFSKGLMLTGNNQCDNLFMYTTKKIDMLDGIEKNTKYSVDLSFDLATNMPSGISNSEAIPGEYAYIKAGIVTYEPISTIADEDNSFYRMNIDKGNKSKNGKDLITLGHAAKKENMDNETYEYKHFNETFFVTSNERGELWIILGIDLGCEGTIRLYFDNIEMTIKKSH